MKEITQERAEQIALAIIRNTWPNRGIKLEDGFYSKLGALAKQIGLPLEHHRYLAYFYAKELLPLAFNKFAGIKIDVIILYLGKDINKDYSAGKIALALLKTEGVDLQPNYLESRLERLAQMTEIPVAELKTFFVQEIIPQALSRVMKWKSCKIIVEETPLPDIGQP